MKRIKLLTLVLINLLLSACVQISVDGDTDTQEKQQEQQAQEVSVGSIKKAELTDQQREILDLLNYNNRYDIYEYQTDEQMQTMRIWLEVYEPGEQTSIKFDSYTKIDYPQGKIAVLLNKQDNHTWTIVRQDAGGKSSSSYVMDSIYGNDDNYNDSNYMKGASTLTDPMNFSENQEVVLAAYLFADGNGLAVYSPQHYVENPDVVKQYNAIYLLKCSFSTDTIANLERAE